jgi:predicted HicB family RNase H-like nuclease
MMETIRQATHDERILEARRQAQERFRMEPDWVRFYREVLGVDGIIDKLFPSFDKRNQFEKTPEYVEIQQMLAKLRERNRVQNQCDEPTRVITVRLPQCLHEALRHEAHNFKTSMNKLCISKLLQVVADELVPSDFERRDEGTDSPEPVRPQPIAATTQSTYGASMMAAPGQPAAHHPTPPPAFGMRPMSPPSLPGGPTF